MKKNMDLTITTNTTSKALAYKDLCEPHALARNEVFETVEDASERVTKLEPTNYSLRDSSTSNTDKIEKDKEDSLTGFRKEPKKHVYGETENKDISQQQTY